MGLPDYSTWLTDERLAAEEKAWLEAGFHKVYAEVVDRALGRSMAPVVLELGCGIGLVPKELICVRNRPCVYYGVDANLECVRRARIRNMGVADFIEADIRDITMESDLEESFSVPRPYLVCSFAVLKHFAVKELCELLARIVRMAPRAIFSIPVATQLNNDGIEFNHSWLTWSALNSIIGGAGKLIDRMTDLQGNEVKDEPTGIEVVISCVDGSVS